MVILPLPIAIRRSRDARRRAAYSRLFDASNPQKSHMMGGATHGMSSSVRAKDVRFDQDSMWVALSDGRTLGVPLAWFPRLLHGSMEQREQVSISSHGLHWEALDEDISIAGLLAGQGDLMIAPPSTRKEQATRLDPGCGDGARQALVGFQ